MTKNRSHFLFHDPIPETVPLGRSPVSSSWAGGLFRGPVADKFFLAGALATLVGAAWLGAHLWLMLNGEMAVSASFAELRRIHIHFQLYLFFGLAILGFLMQAAPRFLQVPVRPSARALWLIPATVFGALISALAPDQRFSQCALALPFLFALVAVIQLLRVAPVAPRREFGSWMLFSLLGFVVGAFLVGEGADRWLIAFWLAVAPMVLGVGQQFIRAFVTGMAIEGRLAFTLKALFLVTGGLMLSAYSLGIDPLWRAAGVAATVLLLTYALRLTLWRVRCWQSRGVLCWAFACAYVWAGIGALLLCVFGAGALDAVLHAWALGWVCPLLFSISAQIMENLAGKFLIERRWQLRLLVLWQLVPIGRSGLAVVMLPAWMSHVVASVSALVFLVWGLAVWIAVRGIWREQQRPVGDKGDG